MFAVVFGNEPVGWLMIGYRYYTSIHRFDKLPAQTKSTKFTLVIYHVFSKDNKHCFHARERALLLRWCQVALDWLNMAGVIGNVQSSILDLRSGSGSTISEGRNPSKQALDRMRDLRFLLEPCADLGPPQNSFPAAELWEEFHKNTSILERYWYWLWGLGSQEKAWSVFRSSTTSEM